MYKVPVQGTGILCTEWVALLQLYGKFVSFLDPKQFDVCHFYRRKDSLKRQGEAFKADQAKDREGKEEFLAKIDRIKKLWG